MNKIIAFIAVALIAASGVSLTTTDAKAHAEECHFIKKVDRNGDGKIGFFEALRAGKTVFKLINDDGDRTLEADEAATRHIGPKTFTKYNRIGRKGLDRIEWSRLVRDRFNAANPDRDFSIECDELQTKRGHKLLAVIYY